MIEEMVYLFLSLVCSKDLKLFPQVLHYFCLIDGQIHRRATIAYGALSTRLGEQTFFFENRWFFRMCYYRFFFFFLFSFYNVNYVNVISLYPSTLSFPCRPSGVDALFLGHALFTLQALPVSYGLYQCCDLCGSLFWAIVCMTQLELYFIRVKLNESVMVQHSSK